MKNLHEPLHFTLQIQLPEEFKEHFKRDAFNDSLNRLKADAHCLAGNYEKELITALIDAFADAEEVVRCKDCKWGKETCGNIECFVDLNAPSEYHGYDWYCPNGENVSE